MVDNKEQHIHNLIFEITSQRNLAMDQLADLSAHARFQNDRIKDLEKIIESFENQADSQDKTSK